MSFPRISCSVYSAVLPSLGPCEVHTSLVTHGGRTRPDSHATECVASRLGSRHKRWLALGLALALGIGTLVCRGTSEEGGKETRPSSKLSRREPAS